jgi:hypothetical protein
MFSGLAQAKDDSAGLSAAIHEENSIVASVLYIPYMVFYVPVRIIEGLINPQPTTQSTVPPVAHKAH